ncbi:MAG: DUF2357 domain-containing protein [Treponema sp.]|jgi:hypothetical protein|nr:DUF2357 domain-containing protein [Treponema sp.]
MTQKLTHKAAQIKAGKNTRKRLKKKLKQSLKKMTLIELYRSYEEEEKAGKKDGASHDFLEQMNWFYVNAKFDPKTNKPLPQPLSTFLAKMAEPDDGIIHDRLWRIADHARESVKRVFRSLNESPRRKQELLPVRAVRELDVNSFIKLSNRPGRNIREKLKDKPYLYAVRRFQSIDLPENRLLKEFVTRLAELFELRYDCLKEKEEDELLPKIKSWLLGDKAKSIGRWENLPPNNTLLSHRDYRRIWDAWRWLQTLDDDINKDLLDFKARRKTIYRWSYEYGYGQKYFDGHFIFVDMPVYFDYEKFEIKPWEIPEEIPWKIPREILVFQKRKKEIVRHFTTEKISEPVCVDFTALRPRYFVSKNSSQGYEENKPCILNETYLWQHWDNNKDKTFNLELFNSDAVFLHSDVKATISFADLFFSKEKKDIHILDRAARAFASKLHETFTDGTLIWLVPDFLNDFELELIRRNINASFPKAEPLPRSVAAVFEKVDYSIISEGFTVVVVDTIGGKTCATKLIARSDEDKRLIDRIPETKGYYWERCPPVIISDNDPDGTDLKNYEIITVDEKGIWYDKAQPTAPEFINPDILKKNERIGQFSLLINLFESPVVGGSRFHDLQQRAGDIPLWRDHMPELKIKVKIGERYQYYNLVSRNTIIEPIRGKPVPIKIKDNFTLPAGKRFYEFPLLQGENDEKVGFSAKLKSPVFPLDIDTVCKLNLTFTYGDDDPYCLVFEPLKEEFPPVKAKWEREEEITDAPAPKYPKPLSWKDLECWKDIQGKEINLLNWLLESLTKWNERIPKPTLKHLPKGAEWKLSNFKKKSLQNRMPIIWADNRSLNDEDAPLEFKQKFNELISMLSKNLPENIFNQRLMPLLSSLHKDTKNNCIKWIMQQVENDQSREYRAIGFALGDVSQEWQHDILSKLKSTPTEKAVRVFAYTVWHEQNFINNFSFMELESILKVLKEMLSQVKPCPPKKDKKNRETVRDWVRSTAEPLELLLGLLRTRESSDPEIKMILWPRQKVTEELADQVENVVGICAQSRIRLFSRIQLDIPKPEGDRTPPLLYALRQYLTGDGGANAIRITGVSNNDNDNEND